MFDVNSEFIGSFKVGDNIHHNLNILSLLYGYYNKSNSEDKLLLVKPIVVTLVSVTEAVIYDFHFRVVSFTKEGVANLSDDVVKDIQSKKISDFEKLIACVRKHNVFNKKPIFYEKLDEIRKLRNRVHIQNIKGEFERDESKVFTEARKVQAEKVLEVVLKTISALYSRGSRLRGVADFSLPWDEHFGNMM